MVKTGSAIGLIDQIGNTPLLKLNQVFDNLDQKIFAKAEMLNPGGSIKDRLAKSLIETAEESGRIKPGSTVIEVTSGNTGIAVSWICAAKGYQAVLVMSDKNSKEKQDMIKEFFDKVGFRERIILSSPLVRHSPS